jgi:hypothetical protein
MIVLCIGITIVVGLLLYTLRCRAQFWYGVCEIVVAVVVIYLVLRPAYDFPIFGGYSPFGMELQKSYGILAGLYIFVRGMDNIRNGMPFSWRASWDRVFGGISSQPPAA